MPYTTKWLNQGIEWRFTGTVTSKEIVGSRTEIYGDARWDSLNFQIADFLDTQGAAFSEDDIKKVAFLDMAASKSNPSMKVAIVTDLEILRDYADLYAAYLLEIDWVVEIFSNRQDAGDWLGIRVV